MQWRAVPCATRRFAAPKLLFCVLAITIGLADNVQAGQLSPEENFTTIGYVVRGAAICMGPSESREVLQYILADRKMSNFFHNFPHLASDYMGKGSINFDRDLERFGKDKTCEVLQNTLQIILSR